jgi:hypothetical protein
MENDFSSKMRQLVQAETSLPLCFAPLSGICFGLSLFTVIWHVSSAGIAVPRFVGLNPEIGGGVSVFILLLCFCTFPFIPLIRKREYFLWEILALSIIANVATALYSFLDGAGGLFGGILYCASHSIFFILSIQHISYTSRRINIGATFCVSGVTMFILYFFYMGVLVGDKSPLLGKQLHGRPWVIMFLCSIGISLSLFILLERKSKVQRKDSAFNILDQLYGGTKTGNDKWSSSVFLVSMLIILSLLLPGVIFRATNKTITKEVKLGEPFTVATWNIQQGYRTNGRYSFSCNIDKINEIKPHFIGFQESDAVHFLSNNRDPMDYISTYLQMDEYFGPPNKKMVVGVGSMSYLPVVRNKFDDLPPADLTMELLNRLLVTTVVKVGDKSVTLMVTHTEWFGNPRAQVEFIMQQVNKTEGPIIVMVIHGIL